MDELILTQPDDWHIHLRDGAALTAVAPHSADVFGRVMAMPNLKPPVTTVSAAQAYRQRILGALPPNTSCIPLLSLYLTESTTVAEVEAAAHSGFIVGFKYYPMGATTHSELGVSDLSRCREVLHAMAKSGLPLQVHGEVTDPAVDVFDREAVFIHRQLIPLLESHPDLRVIFEHITTRAAVEFIQGAGAGVAATITPQHLLYNRNALFQGGLRPHHYCLPVLKREEHRQALLHAVASGHPRFFLGTDSAPHSQSTKEASCGCAGIYSAHAALPLYAEAFESVGALSLLEGFASHFGADFYGLPRNQHRIRLIRQSWTVPPHYPFGSETLIPLRANETLAWKVVQI
ncbi:MAG: dihydroorotase [Ferrovum sp.]|nr:dihydroorotase [Ferrovum sp.]NDU86985.1 dihydroorotase [Ferrovum sp.]